MRRTLSALTILAVVVFACAEAGVKEWAPPVKRGKRTFSDERFVTSVQKQLDDGEKPVSQRQLEAMMRIGARYIDQVPEMKTVILDCGFEKLLKDDSVKPPRDTSIRKLGLLKDVDLDESAKSFSESLRRQVEGGRRLSDAQVRALDNMVVAHAKQIEDFETVKKELELGENDAAVDHESGPLIEAMNHVKEWREPVTRGKRVFNDKTFFESLASHFDRKGFLTPRQRTALRKMTSKYREQIPNFDDVMQRVGERAKSPNAEASQGHDKHAQA